jgi:hypothetical protein
VLTFHGASFPQSGPDQRFLLSLAQLFEQALYLEDLFTFFDLEPRSQYARCPSCAISFDRGSSSRMSGSATPARAVGRTGPQLRAQARQTLALVGENGASRPPSLLLARLYD